MDNFLQRARQRVQFGWRRCVPQMMQSEVAECGLACVAMVASFYGLHVDLLTVRKSFGISSRGATLQQLMHIAEHMQMRSRGLSLTLEELPELRLPCIVHWDMCHFVVLVARKKKHWVVHDPAFGRRLINEEEMSRHFTGVALELWPSPAFVERIQRTQLHFGKLLANVSGLARYLSNIFFFSLLIETVNLLLPVGTQLVMDHVIVAEDHHLLTLICVGLLFFIVFRSGMAMLRSWSALVMGVMIDVQWKAGVFDHLLKLPLAFFEKRKLGDIQARFQALDTIRTTLTTGVVSGIIDSIMTIGLSIMLWMYGGWLVWIVLGFTLLYMALRLSTYHYYRQASEEHLVKGAKAASHFMETLYGIGTLKALGLSSARAQHWLNLNAETANAGIRLTRFDMLFSGASAFIGTLDQIIILWLGASQVIDGAMTLGMFVAFNAYRGQFSERAASLINIVLQMRMLNLHSDRLADIVFSTAEEVKPHREIVAPGEPAALEVCALHYQYDALSAPIIAGVDITVAAGESVAITGPSGVGKTTLLKIMAGLLTPTHGKILCNDLDIYAVGIHNYRRCMACVLQDDKLFSGSIAENVMGFAEDADKAWMIACAQACNIHDEIMRMPMGYDTLLSELGGGLSGGQKQRLLIARALYRRPSILLLDEATSHLDLANEAHINAAIATLQITRIFIAHRPSTIASADRIISL